MHTSSVIFNTKPVLAQIHANNCYIESRDSYKCSYFAANFRVQSKKPISWRPQRGRPTWPSNLVPVSSKNLLFSTVNAVKDAVALCKGYLLNPKVIASRSSNKTSLLTTRRRYSSQLNELIPQSRLADKSQQVTCFHPSKRKQIGVNRFTSGFFVDKSTFHLRKHKLDDANVRQFEAPHATVGPEEPHAASTAWPDGIMEKEGLDLLESEVERKEFENFLRFELPSHPKLHRGQLKNGLRYLILPNKVPPNRFEAHMEVHVGSIDEEDDEQGIAHMIEHVAFLGSKKREKLLGTGARSNAYTDFHHTVFHIHSPTSTKDSEGDLLPVVLDALNEIAFHPKFLTSRVEKERRAILSELQMMNTIEYRVDCQLLQHLHSENKLSKRFPIGLEEQIKKWDADKIRKFHERWYFPANATLYIVGDIDDISKTVNHIEAVFGQTGMESEVAAAPTPSAFGAMASFLVPKLSVGLASGLSQERPTVDYLVLVLEAKNMKQSLDSLPSLFSYTEMIPVSKVRTYGDLRNVLMKRIFLSALHFRINTRYQSSNPPFTSVELDHSDSGREGCTVTTLTVNAEPQNWQNAIKVAVLEVRRLKEFGVTNGELARYLDALLKDSEQLAAMIDNRQGHESLVAVAGTVTLEEVNSIGAEVLEFISDYGKPSAPHPAAIVACVPKKVHIDGIGETDFKIEPEEIVDAIEAGLKEPIEAEPELEIPKELISSEQLQELRLKQNPSFIPVDQEQKTTKISKSEANSGVMRLIVGGGRAAETAEAKGAVIVGVRTLSEGGRVGNFSVELFCVNHLINCSLESTEEFICMEFRFTLRDDGMRAAFQLLHMVLELFSSAAFSRSPSPWRGYEVGWIGPSWG
ncbi:Stromal processing peptidase, chloroplastic [Sesamum angolense]|uniref:Stromal processing peptidase, chloroplastic n=1 Tax=Sesamum angolense TaxID=2727404 RepID=A0AAE1XFW9_9LAMI|nr:Stromal processing peptidase, chloroplastic [Sesamum angolense]